MSCSADAHWKEWPAAVVIGQEAQVAALRALLSFDPGYQRLHQQLAGEGHPAGYGDLVWSALALPSGGARAARPGSAT
jgi:hypothetical protein